jgi:glyoxylate reductase
MATRVLVTGTSVRSDLLRPLVDAGCAVDNPTHLLSEGELTTALAQSTAYLLGGDEYASRTALASAKQLKVIAFLGMGYEAFVDVSAANEFGISITNTPGTLSNSVAEFTVGLLLSSTRKLHYYAAHYLSGQTGVEAKQHDLSALHVGIVGLGGIGVRIAEILRNGFNTKVSYYSRTRKPAEEARLGLSYLPLPELVGQVDALIVMTPGNSETAGLIDNSLISTAKPGLILVNSARPEIVDVDALLAGIESGQISYAAFDSFYDRNVPAVEKLKALSPMKLMITPHVGSLTHEARDGMARKATQSILNVLRTGTDEYIVNKA